MLESPDQGVRSEVGPFGCCKGSGLCSECDGDPGECEQSDYQQRTVCGACTSYLWLHNK